MAKGLLKWKACSSNGKLSPPSLCDCFTFQSFVSFLLTCGALNSGRQAEDCRHTLCNNAQRRERILKGGFDMVRTIEWELGWPVGPG